MLLSFPVERSQESLNAGKFNLFSQRDACYFPIVNTIRLLLSRFALMICFVSHQVWILNAFGHRDQIFVSNVSTLKSTNATWIRPTHIISPETTGHKRTLDSNVLSEKNVPH